MSESENKDSIDIIVPDIGDSENVEVIEILVAVGDAVSIDDSLLTLESDKASMEIPASQAGVVESLNIQIGDTLNSGDVIGTMSIIEAAATTETQSINDTSADDTSAVEPVETPKNTNPAPAPAVVSPTPTAPSSVSSTPSASPTAHIS